MGFIIIAILGILGAGLIGGGIVLYRGSMSNGIKAAGAACIAAGVIMLALIIWVTPVCEVTG